MDTRRWILKLPKLGFRLKDLQKDAERPCPDAANGLHAKDNQGLCHNCGIQLPEWFW